MQKQRRFGFPRWSLLGLVLVGLAFGVGCSLDEALRDGFFGAISETVARTVTDILGSVTGA